MIKEFAEVQLIINDSLKVIDGLRKINMKETPKEVRLYLLSQIKKHIGIVGTFVLTYDKKQE